MCTTGNSNQRTRRSIRLSIRLREARTSITKHTLFSGDDKSIKVEERIPTPTSPEKVLPNVVSTGKSSIKTVSSYDNEDRKECPITGVYSDILNDYLVLPRVIGNGHYGRVRECFRRKTHDIYAVKSMDKSKMSNHDQLRREIGLLREVNHSKIVKMVGFYEDEQYVHIVTEKYTGGELFNRIIKNTSPEGCFTEGAAAKIVKSLLEAVDYLHDRNIVHRDIKPENILFETASDESDIKLIDFGLSRKHRKNDPPMKKSVGTAYYMSPEVLYENYDRSCDLWSVGVVAYALLCGYPPFNGDSDDEICDQIRSGEFSFAGYGWGHESKEARDFIKGLLHVCPSKRMSAKKALQHPWILKHCSKL